jgi:hypothetical protein
VPSAEELLLTTSSSKDRTARESSLVRSGMLIMAERGDGDAARPNCRVAASRSVLTALLVRKTPVLVQPTESERLEVGCERELFRIVWSSVAFGHADVLADIENDSLAARAADLYLQSVPNQILTLLRAALTADVPYLRGRSSDLETHLEAAIASDELQRDLFRRYPGLSRMLEPQLRHWMQAAREFALRLSADMAIVRDLLGAAEDPNLECVEPSWGDPHRQLRCTTLVRFREGVVVYKPVGLGGFEGIKGILNVLARHAGCDPITFPRAVDRGEHCWLQWIQKTPCTSEASVRNYYRRLGELHALAWTCGAEDLHSDNIVACADVPVVVDIETLMSPGIPSLQPAGTEVQTFPVSESPLTTGILPFTLEIDGRMYADHSAFSDTGAPPSHAPPSLPFRSNNEPVDPLAYGDEFVAGAHGVLSRLTDCFPAVEAYLQSTPGFADNRIRVVLRDTVAYSQAYRRLLSAECLRNPGAFNAAFESLLEIPKARLHDPLRVVRSHERDDIINGDIPYFAVRLCGTELIGTRLHEPSYFECSALEKMKTRTSGVARSADAVLWSTIAAIKVAQANRDPTLLREVVRCKARPTPTKERAIEAVRLIAERICRLAYRRRAEVGWLTVRACEQPFRHLRLVRTDYSLAYGSAGILLFLRCAEQLVGVSSEVSQLVALLHSMLRAVLNSEVISRETSEIAGVLAKLYESSPASIMTNLTGLVEPEPNLDTCGANGDAIAAAYTEEVIGRNGVIRHRLGIDPPHLSDGAAGIGCQILRWMNVRRLLDNAS